MAYESVDQLQKALTENVFGYANDSKKAAGRALGTIVEIITFYLLKSWGLNNAISIERRIPEFGNPDITHNVEYSIHPVFAEYTVEIENDGTSLTANRLLKALRSQGNFREFQRTNNYLLSQDGILRNACTIAQSDDSYLIASISQRDNASFSIAVSQQSMMPYAIFECKRVGVEEGMKKGPQTIEKAKQGAYVAKTVSSLQKLRLENGDLYGIVYKDGQVLHSKPYYELLQQVIGSDDPHLLRNFMLTIGVVSNHGNWFTAGDHNKELKVLAQSYDWLIFLTDEGITEFIEELILSPLPHHQTVRDAFIISYAPGKKKNQFTKVQMNLQADEQILAFFATNVDRIEQWFHVISPIDGSLDGLRGELDILKSKRWSEILQ
jgi:hypothetical protein